MADALVAPDFKDAGLLDTAVVTIRYDNGAIAVAEASFSAAYGYDVRGEVFGSAGMVTAGSPAHLSTAHWSAAGVASPTARADTDLIHRRVCRRARGLLRRRSQRQPDAGRGRGRPRRAPDRARLHRSRRDRRHRGRARHGPGWRLMGDWPLHARCQLRDGLRRPALRRTRAPDPRARLPGRDLGLDAPRHRRARGPARRGRRLLVDDRLRARAPRPTPRAPTSCSRPRPSRCPWRSGSASRASTCTAPASTAGACPVPARAGRDRADVADRAAHAGPHRRAGRARGRHVRPREPQHRRRPPRRALRPRGRLPRPRRGGGQPAPAS